MERKEEETYEKDVPLIFDEKSGTVCIDLDDEHINDIAVYECDECVVYSFDLNNAEDMNELNEKLGRMFGIFTEEYKKQKHIENADNSDEEK